jgi:hypothetical protein
MFLGSRRLIGQSVNDATHAWLGDRCLWTRPGERYFLPGHLKRAYISFVQSAA